MNLRCLAILMACTLIQACVSTSQRTILTKENREAVQQLNLYNLIVQDEIRPAVVISQVSVATGGGLIPMLIDASINKKRNDAAQNMIEPVYDATDHIDYRAIWAEAVNAALESSFTLTERPISAEKVMLKRNELLKKISELKDGQALMHISSTYGFKNDSKIIMAESVVSMYAAGFVRKGSSKTLPKPIYSNRFVYLSESVGDGANLSLARWAENDGALLVQTLNDIAKQTAALLAEDLKATSTTACGRPAYVYGYGFDDSRIKLNGSLYRQENGRAFILTEKDQMLVTAPKNAVILLKHPNSQRPKSASCS